MTRGPSWVEEESTPELEAASELSPDTCEISRHHKGEMFHQLQTTPARMCTIPVRLCNNCNISQNETER